MAKADGIDIIIPVYNAFDELQKCVESVFACTDLARHRMILVNDASPDVRIAPYLDSLKGETVLVAENEKNLGFAGSINRGIRLSENRDVVLLNSDTIVTENWVEKLIACAFSDTAIATVTPLSNNATLCSVPEFLKENAIPGGYTLAEYARLVETVSLRRYPRIPVANGFCMYIKRATFDKIGLFDEETFGRGYGEENDFCYRAGQAGYCHVMCDDTYIFHKGTASFVSEEKKKYIDMHERILDERYSGQNHVVAAHCRDNPNAAIQDNIRIWEKLRNGRKNLLYLVQSDFRRDAADHLGGTQLHVKDMTSCMRGVYNVFVAARNVDFLNVTAYTGTEELCFKFYIGDCPQYPEFRSKKFAELYGRLLDGFCIGLVHIHHTRNLTLELYYEAKKRQIPIITTLHDYYTLCPQIKMMDARGRLCAGRNDTDCKACLHQKEGIYQGLDYRAIWRGEQQKALGFSEKIIFPSNSARQIVERYEPDIHPKTMVIPHGVARMEPISAGNAAQLHVAFIGGISREKGEHIAVRLIKNGPPDAHWHLFGTWGYNELSMTDRKNYTKTGLYEREELAGLMEAHQIDLVCILPVWAETYCYTLSEAVMCGVPVIATDIGALGERVREMDCGWLVPVENAYEETLALINKLKDKGSEYQEKRAHIRTLRIKTLEEMASQYGELYRELYRERRQDCEIGSDKQTREYLLNGYLVACGLKSAGSDDLSCLRERMDEMENRLTAITTSFTYKCMQALGEIPIPCRKQIKKLLYIVYRTVKRN